MAIARVAEFDIWRAGYGGATVYVYLAGTTTEASIYTDEALSVAASNPQTLDSVTINDRVYGKFLSPLYIAAAYELNIVSMDQTGVIRPPLTTLSAEDASAATVLPSGGARAVRLDELLGREFNVEDTAALGISSATNSATITTALGRASSAGGGRVILPGNTAIPFNQLTVSSGVQLVGLGRTGTPTVLQSQVAGAVVTLGDGAGLSDITLDGVNKIASGIGSYSKGSNETSFNNVLIKRFATGVKQIGGRYSAWHDFYIDACGTGGDFQGNLDTSGGDLWTANSWYGGEISNCTVYGLSLSYVDKVVSHNSFHNLRFTNNTGTALFINGARFVTLHNCHFSGNTTNIAIQDDDLTTVTDNTVRGFRMIGGSIDGGAITFDGACVDIVFERVVLTNVDFTLTNVSANITLLDCTEDSNVTFSGQGTRITRRYTELFDAPGSAVTTTDAVALTAWQYTLEPGQIAWVEAKVVGVQRNGVDYGIYHIGRGVRRAGSALKYKAQVTNFTVGEVVTGGTSNATARIVADTDAGLTGTLTVKNILGAFIDNEPLTDSAGGDATCDGTLTAANAALLGSTTAIEAAVETVAGYASDFAVSSGNVEIQVTGDTGDTIDWTVNASVTVN